jgi:hypothetical protein
VNPDLTLPTHQIGVAESVSRILELLKKRGFVS